MSREIKASSILPKIRELSAGLTQFSPRPNVKACASFPIETKIWGESSKNKGRTILKEGQFEYSEKKRYHSG